MQAFRSLLLVSTISLGLTQVALAQVPDYQFEFVPMDQPKIPNRDNLSWHIRFATKDHTVQLMVPSSGKDKRKNFIYAYSRETGVVEGEVIIGTEGNESTYLDKFIELNDRLYVIYEVYDRKIGRVDVFAQEYILPGLISKGTPVLVGSINFDPKSLDYIGALNAHFKQSPDGEHLAFYFDRLLSREEEQLVQIFMMDGDLKPVWDQVYTIETESGKVYAHGWEVNNSGTVYSLMGGKFKNRSTTNKPINYSFSLFMMTSEGMGSQPLDMPIDLSAQHPKLVLNGDAPRVGGFFMEPRNSEREVGGHFLADFDVDLQQPIQMRTQKFEPPMEYQLMRSNLLQRADGGCFLVGAFWEHTQVGNYERLLLAISMDAFGATEWTTSVPRHLKPSNIYVDYEHRALLAQDRLLLLFPDTEDNLPLYQAGMEPELKKGIKHVYLAAGFNEEGAPSYRSFIGSEPYSFGISGIHIGKPINSNTFACSADRGVDKNDSKAGILYITFE